MFEVNHFIGNLKGFVLFEELAENEEFGHVCCPFGPFFALSDRRSLIRVLSVGSRFAIAPHVVANGNGGRIVRVVVIETKIL